MSADFIVIRVETNELSTDPSMLSTSQAVTVLAMSSTEHNTAGGLESTEEFSGEQPPTDVSNFECDEYPDQLKSVDQVYKMLSTTDSTKVLRPAVIWILRL